MPQIKTIADPGADNVAMSDFWNQVDTIINGIKAMRDARETYLPKFPNESDKDYKFRLKTSTMTNVYRDVVEGLANKPFSEEANIKDGSASSDIMKLAEDIDGRGNHIHVFLSETFFSGISAAIDWILVDYPSVDSSEVRTVADERRAGYRPYWIHVPAKNVLEIRTTMNKGIEVITYARIFEPGASDDDDQVRVFEREGDAVTWELHKKDENKEWQRVGGGNITIGIIPLVPFYTGRRKGSSWQFHPPLKDAADLQVELFQKETALKHIRTLTCFPMLAANGVAPDVGPDGKPKPVPMGPAAVLYAPPNDDGKAGSWERISSDAESLKFLAEDIKATIEQIRELGKQPLTAQSGNVTRISAAFAATKGNSAVQKWALGLKDAAEQALMITALWLTDASEPEFEIFTDFQVESEEDDAPKHLLEMYTKRALSRHTLWTEFKRRGKLSSEFDPEEEIKRIAEESIESDPFDEGEETEDNPPENNPAQ